MSGGYLEVEGTVGATWDAYKVGRVSFVEFSAPRSDVCGGLRVGPTGSPRSGGIWYGNEGRERRGGIYHFDSRGVGPRQLGGVPRGKPTAGLLI